METLADFYTIKNETGMVFVPCSDIYIVKNLFKCWRECNKKPKIVSENYKDYLTLIKLIET